VTFIEHSNSYKLKAKEQRNLCESEERQGKMNERWMMWCGVVLCFEK
jgi:hypothetical protein